MSGKKKLERFCRTNRVVAMPSRKKESIIKDGNGDTMRDKSGEVLTDKTQLYNIYKMY